MNSMTNTPAWSVLTHHGSAYFLKAGGYLSLLIGRHAIRYKNRAAHADKLFEGRTT
jgi:hypothetical protein